MPYNVELHHRRSVRLKGYDYSQAGLYFITICCEDKVCRFGEIENGEMLLSDAGKIAYNEWQKLPERYPCMSLDVFQIMPNHMHGIIRLHDVPVTAPATVGATLAVAQPQPQPQPPTPPKNPVIGRIIGAYKSLVANKCLEVYRLRRELMGKLWQRSYYEHIICNENAYENISNYIINNPAKWKNDSFYF